MFTKTKSLLRRLWRKPAGKSECLAPANKPWQLIRDAIHDLKLQEQNPKVCINMEVWLITPIGDEVCQQCLAGATVARRCDLQGNNTWLVPSFLPEPVANKMYALNAFRVGAIKDGLSYLGLLLPPTMPAIGFIPEYDDTNPATFHNAMLRLADDLERAFAS